jgi:hypothetical protein
VTTICEVEVTCAICGSQQTVREIGSTNAVGPMDLDTRPPQMKRSTLHLWVHECEECGYVAADLGDAAEARQTAPLWHAYLAELNRADRPRVANRFVCRSLFDEAAGEHAAAGWRRLHAAWACDDAEQADEARVQRRAALECFERARAAGQRAEKSMIAGDEMLLADIARRAGEFAQAESYVAAGLAQAGVSSRIAGWLEFQRKLAAERDIGRHTVDEAYASGEVLRREH